MFEIGKGGKPETRNIFLGSIICWILFGILIFCFENFVGGMVGGLGVI